jgi:hypothetical protein
MSTKDEDGLSAVVARQRGRSRLRVVTVAAGAAGLVAAGAVAYTLPSGIHSVSHAVGTSVSTGTGSTVHTVSGGSGVVTQTAGGTSVSPRSGSSVHATSGGS